MKKILIVSRSFYPTNSPRAFRTTELAKEFARQGHDVSVLTPKDKKHKEFAEKHRLKIEDLGNPKWKEIKIKKGGFGSLFKRIFRRVLHQMFEYPRLEYFFKVRKELKKKIAGGEHYDLLISIAVPYSVHWGVASVWKKNDNLAKTWVADCGDPFMGQENDSFRPLFYFKYVEKWFCRKPDFLTVPVDTAIEGYYKEFHHKIKVIPQGFNFENIKKAPPQKNPFPHFAYAGSLIPVNRDPKDFLQFLVNSPKCYKFDIYTKNVDLVKPFSDLSEGRIEIKGFLPREELLYNLSKMDFLVNFENAGTKQIPSKIIDYIILEKPVLSINSFDFNEEAAEAFLNGDYSLKMNIDNPQQYKIENVAEEFLKLTN